MGNVSAYYYDNRQGIAKYVVIGFKKSINGNINIFKILSMEGAI